MIETTPTMKSAETDRRRSLSSLPREAFSLPVVLGALLLAATFTGRYLNIDQSTPHSGSASNISFEGDTWWHATVGEHILSTGHWPTKDTYSFTVHGSPWIAYEWLGEVIMAFASRLAGLKGLMALLLVMCGAFVLLLYYYAYQNSKNPMAAFLACIALLPLASSFFTLRPQMFGYAFLILTLIALERFRCGHPRALWLLPGLFLIWANIHGTFFFGFLVIGVYWAAGLREFQFKFVRAEQWTPKQRRQLELTFLLCLLATVVTPYGSRLAAYPLEMVLFQSANLRSNTEFLPIPLHSFEGELFIALLLFFIVFVVLARPVFRVEEAALFLFATYEAFAHVRLILFFVLIFAPLLAKALDRWLPAGKDNREHPILNAVLLCFTIAVLVELFPSRSQISQAVACNFPAGAVAYLSQHPVPGPMFNELSWGGYLIWSLGPKHQVFIDGREDIYDYAGVLSDYLGIIEGQGRAFFLLRKYGVHSCLTLRKSKLARLLGASPDWKVVYQDQLSVIFLRAGMNKVAGQEGVGQGDLLRGKSPARFRRQQWAPFRSVPGVSSSSVTNKLPRRVTHFISRPAPMTQDSVS